MSSQTFGDESNYKHEPKSDHYVDDKFGKGTNTRNWKKNLDETLEASKEDILVDQESQESQDNEERLTGGLMNKEETTKDKTQETKNDKAKPGTKLDEQIKKMQGKEEDPGAISQAGRKRSDEKRYQ